MTKIVAGLQLASDAISKSRCFSTGVHLFHPRHLSSFPGFRVTESVSDLQHAIDAISWCRRSFQSNADLPACPTLSPRFFCRLRHHGAVVSSCCGVPRQSRREDPRHSRATVSPRATLNSRTRPRTTVLHSSYLREISKD